MDRDAPPVRLTLSVDLCNYAALDVLYRLDFQRAVRVEVRRPTGQMGWVFPEDPFITYEPRDEAWCRPLGIGHVGSTFAPPIVIERGVIFPSRDGFEVRDARPRIGGEMIARFFLPD